MVELVQPGGSGSGGTNVALERLLPTQSGSNITLNLTQLSNVYLDILGIFKNGQLLNETDASFGWSQAGDTITVLNGFTSDIFYVDYTYA